MLGTGVAALLLAAALATTGCSPGTSATPSRAGEASPPVASQGPGSPSLDTLLTVADVEKISGIKGLVVVPRDPSRGAGGDLNFGTGDGRLVVMFQSQPGDLYAKSKSFNNSFRAEVKGLGDEAFEGPAASVRPEAYTLTIRKGDHTVAFASFFDMANGGRNFLSMDELKQLAAIVVGRL
jgi:hypothetical protein